MGVSAHSPPIPPFHLWKMISVSLEVGKIHRNKENEILLFLIGWIKDAISYLPTVQFLWVCVLCRFPKCICNDRRINPASYPYIHITRRL